MRDFFDREDTDSILLVNASNIFNSLNTTQGDPLAMLMYAVSLVSLIQLLYIKFGVLMMLSPAAVLVT